LQNERSTLPLIGPLINRFRENKEQFVLKFQSVDTHIQKVMQELSNGEISLKARNDLLEDMFVQTNEECKQLSIEISAGRVTLLIMQEEIQKLIDANPNPSPQLAQEINDLKAVHTRLDQRIHNLITIQASSIQTLPMIRMIQSSNATLIEKFHNVKELTIPAWKRQFLLALSLNEQKKAAQLAQNIDDSTNEFLRKNAELLNQNAVHTARINQRSVIDIETLEYVQKSLIDTLTSVRNVYNEGFEKRRDAEQRINILKKELNQNLISQD
jgi:uncharacterized protein YaaN involved in tellurite resistance